MSEADARRTLREAASLLEQDPIVVEALQELCFLPGGLINQAMRRRVWPRLLGVDPACTKTCLVDEHTDDSDQGRRKGSVAGGSSAQGGKAAGSAATTDSGEEEEDESEGLGPATSRAARGSVQYRDKTQVILDVNRSLWRYPASIRMSRRKELRRQLAAVIHSVLQGSPHLYYYQGLHEIAAVLMLTTTPDMAFSMLARLASCHLRDYLGPNLKGVLAQMDLIYVLLSKEDPEIHSLLKRNELEPHFALSWVLTWFSHVFDDFETVCRIYDVCLASHPLMIIYLSASMVVEVRKDLFGVEESYVTLYKVLNTLKEDVSLESVIQRARDFMGRTPPSALLGEESIPSASKALLKQSGSLARYTSFLASIKRVPQSSGKLADDFVDYEPASSVMSDRGKVAAVFMAYALGASIWAISMMFGDQMLSLLSRP